MSSSYDFDKWKAARHEVTAQQKKLATINSKKNPSLASSVWKQLTAAKAKVRNSLFRGGNKKSRRSIRRSKKPRRSLRRK